MLVRSRNSSQDSVLRQQSRKPTNVDNTDSKTSAQKGTVSTSVFRPHASSLEPGPSQAAPAIHSRTTQPARPMSKGSGSMSRSSVENIHPQSSQSSKSNSEFRRSSLDTVVNKQQTTQPVVEHLLGKSFHGVLKTLELCLIKTNSTAIVIPTRGTLPHNL